MQATNSLSELDSHRSCFHPSILYNILCAETDISCIGHYECLYDPALYDILVHLLNLHPPRVSATTLRYIINPIDNMHWTEVIWLEDLSPNIKRYQYKGSQQFHEILDAEYGHLQQDGDAIEWLLSHVDKETFTQDFCNVEDTQSTSWSSFSATENLLLVKMMTYEHSTALGAFGNALTQALVPMDLGLALQTYAGAIVEGGKNNKQADNGWGPKRPPPGHDRKWPTIVLEVAVSEP